MVTRPERLAALSQFLEGLAALSEQTGVGIHGPAELDADGQRFAFRAECRDDGAFEYGLTLTAPAADHRARLAAEGTETT